MGCKESDARNGAGINVEEALPCSRLELQIVAGVISRGDGTSGLDLSTSEFHGLLSLRLQVAEALLGQGCGWQSHDLHAGIHIAPVHLLRRPEIIALWCFEDACPLKAPVVAMVMRVVMVVVTCSSCALEAVAGCKEHTRARMLHVLLRCCSDGREGTGSSNLGSQLQHQLATLSGSSSRSPTLDAFPLTMT